MTISFGAHGANCRRSAFVAPIACSGHRLSLAHDHAGPASLSWSGPGHGRSCFLGRSRRWRRTLPARQRGRTVLSLDAETVEIIGWNRLVSQLVADGLEVARPER